MTTTVSPIKRALIVVDVQNDFIDGSLPVPGGDDVAARVADLIITIPYDGVYTTQDWHIDPGTHWSETPDYVDTWPVHGKAGTDGAELSPRLEPALDKVTNRFYKGQHAAAYSGFEGVDIHGKTLAETLWDAGVTDVDVVGLATDYCVRATALDAVRVGFNTRLLTPFIAAVNDESGKAAIEEMAIEGVEVVR